MEEAKLPYQTLESEGSSELVVDRSRFIGFARPVDELDVALGFVDELRSEHYDARHVCYGVRIGHGASRIDRSNDDGEPSRTGGFPLWQLLDGADVTNAIIAVVRYYGGVKLGTGGLARAYRDAGRSAMEEAGVTTHHPEYRWSMTVPYAILDTLEHRMKSVEGVRLIDKEYGVEVGLALAAEWRHLDDVRAALGEILQRDPEGIAPEAEPDE